MGKGIIKSGGTDGLYGVELTLHRDRLDAITKIIDSQIAALTTEIDGMEEGDAKELKKLNRASYEKRKEYILNNMPEDPTVSAWCGDLTEDLSGNVGTIEIPGERGIVQIQPGYDDNAAYNTERDGQLQPAIANTPAGTFYNLAMLPGWQKWMPTYRHGIISNIDTDNDTCDVALDVVESSQQGLAVNQESNLSGIPIEYMSCNSSAFEDGDSVLVKFEEQKQSRAKVIGFVDKPKQCDFKFKITRDDGVVIDHLLMSYRGIYIFQPPDTGTIIGLAYGYDPENPDYWTHEVDEAKGIDVWTFLYDEDPDYIYTWSYNVITQIWTVPFFEWEKPVATGKSFLVTFNCEDSIKVQYVVPSDPEVPEYAYKTADCGKEENLISVGFYEAKVPFFEKTYTYEHTWFDQVPTIGWEEFSGAEGCSGAGGYISPVVKQSVTIRSSVDYTIRFRVYNPRVTCYHHQVDPSYWYWYCQIPDGGPYTVSGNTSNGDSSVNIALDPIDSEATITTPYYVIGTETHLLEFEHSGGEIGYKWHNVANYFDIEIYYD